MNPYTEITLANLNKDDATGPTLQIDTSDGPLRHRLMALRDELVASDPVMNGYVAPEVRANRPGVQADIVVEALLASGGKPVHTWALCRAQPHVFGPVVSMTLAEVCGQIDQITGVRSSIPGN